ncbi:PfkB family carbohydrate kinase [Aquipuribacter nitratireducens]|uniref:PfkB family carbohydrate kinase n=1 Tax=Aquipuribacter nitratireducens TaxID=650104 RepID=A0ABW0GLB9_9MICO
MTRPVRLVVVGDTLLDRDVTGRVERTCPDAPDAPVLDVETVHDRPGGAGLAALLCAAPGVEVTLATGLGDDAAGARVAAALRGRVRLRPVLRTATTVGKTRVRHAGTSLVRLDDAGHLLGPASPGSTDSSDSDGSDGSAGSVRPIGGVEEATLRTVLRGADAVLVADYGGAVTRHPAVRAAVEAAGRTVPVVWDPHPRGLPPVPTVAVATPNRAEAERTTDLPAGTPADDLARALLRRWRVAGVTVTDGAAGATTALTGRNGTVHCPAPAVDSSAPLDPCGAGDRFAGGVAAALAGGADTVGAVSAAAAATSRWLAAGGVTTLPLGPAGQDPLPGSLPPAPRPRVVATGGCFDVLHAGHLALLQAAAGMGDRLVVLVNSDDSVRRLKGPGRPVQAQEDRVRLLAALRCVDEVVVFDEDTPTEVLARLRPDVWVKGGDYDPDALPETPTVRERGGRVAVVPVVSGRSTTSILARGAASARPTHPGDGLGEGEAS